MGNAGSQAEVGVLGKGPGVGVLDPGMGSKGLRLGTSSSRNCEKNRCSLGSSSCSPPPPVVAGCIPSKRNASNLRPRMKEEKMKKKRSESATRNWPLGIGKKKKRR